MMILFEMESITTTLVEFIVNWFCRMCDNQHTETSRCYHALAQAGASFEEGYVCRTKTGSPTLMILPSPFADIDSLQTRFCPKYTYKTR
jgi:hypothetical protein